MSAEEELIASLRIYERLVCTVAKPGGLREFALSFYFIRYGFYRLNFIVGARAGPHEVLWSGLVYNLMEELGAGKGPTHNQLYRDFMQELGVPSEDKLVQPEFAKQFNERWETYCSTAAFDEALASLGLYEILDQPDYAMLLGVVKACEVSRKAQEFYRVHAVAEHFDLFEEVMREISSKPEGSIAIARAADFVISNQRMMWSGLLSHLERPHSVVS